MATLPRWRSALRRVKDGVANATILVAGDSLSAGCDSTGNGMGSNARSQSWPSQLAGLVTSVPASAASWMGDANCTGDGKTLEQYDSRISRGAGWSDSTNNTTLGHYAQWQNAGNLNALTFTPGVSFDTIRVYFATWAGSPNYTVNIGGGALATLTMDRAADPGIRYMDVQCSLGNNPVNVVATGDFGSIGGCAVWNSSVKQVNVINAGWWGSALIDWRSEATSYSPLPGIRAVAADLTIIMLGGNDCLGGTTGANVSIRLSAIIDVALENGDVLVCGFTPVNPATIDEATQDAYLGYLQTAAEAKGVPFINFKTRPGWASYAAAVAAGFKAADGIHNTATGYADIAQAIRDEIDFQISRPAADLSDGAWATVPSSANVFEAINESTPSDTDYAITSYASTLDVELEPIQSPNTDGELILSYRLASSAGGFVVSLKQGSTTIASWTHPSGGNPATFERSLSPAERAAISYPATLKLVIEATA